MLFKSIFLLHLTCILKLKITLKQIFNDPAKIRYIIKQHDKIVIISSKIENFKMLLISHNINMSILKTRNQKSRKSHDDEPHSFI